jgi:hypothetical protein
MKKNRFTIENLAKSSGKIRIQKSHAKFLVLNLAQEKNPCLLNKKSESRYSAFGSFFLNKVGSKFSDPRVGPLEGDF